MERFLVYERCFFLISNYWIYLRRKEGPYADVTDNRCVGTGIIRFLFVTVFLYLVIGAGISPKF
ncbi:hypothetical protein SAMN05444162_1468 [Paenibacillaceae bacterium GAS479]|nr:hypothetical protein SAMN05444162_1468 [Paenibacillaceae bacterium GAS479]